MADESTAVQWQVALASDPTFSSPVYDSGEVAVSTTHQVATPLDASTAYIWHVRIRYSESGLTNYSTATIFTTEILIIVNRRITGDGDARVTGDGDQRVVLEV